MKTRRKNGRIYICHTYYHAYIATVKELIRRHNDYERADIMLSTMSNDFGNLKQRLEASKVFDLLLGDNLAGRKEHIAENGSKYLDQLDVS